VKERKKESSVADEERKKERMKQCEGRKEGRKEGKFIISMN